MSFFPATHSPYVTRHRAALTFRIRIPLELQACLGRKEYRRSLGRCYATEAKLRALRLAAAALEVFAFAREAVQGRATRPPLTRQASAGYTTAPANSEEKPMPQRKNPSRPVSTQRAKEPQSPSPAAAPPASTSAATAAVVDSLTDEDIRAIAEEWLLAALKGHDALMLQSARARRDIAAAMSTAEDGEEGEEEEEAAEAARQTRQGLKGLYKKALRQGDMTRMRPMADKELSLHGVRPPATEEGKEASLTYLKTCQELAKAQVTYLDIVDQNSQGDYTAYDATVQRLEERQQARREKRRIRVEDKPAAAPVAAAVNAEGGEKPLTVSAAVDRYMQDRIMERVWSEHTRIKHRDKFSLFRELVDPDNAFPLSRLGAEHMRSYKAALYGWPANRSKVKEYRDMPTAALLEKALAGAIPEGERLEPGTLRNHFQQIKAFLNWAARNEYHHNPAIAALLEVKLTKQAHELRDPFTRGELARIFNPAVYTSASDKDGHHQGGGGEPHRFWLPLLGLFTGARIEELAQLHTEDVILFDPQSGESRPFVTLAPQEAAAVLVRPPSAPEANAPPVLCLDIHKGRPWQTLKNPASARLVPLSPVLLYDLGFLAYVAETHRQSRSFALPAGAAGDAGRLFPELKKTAALPRFSHHASKWFGRYRKAIGLTAQEGGGKKDFHSFRDTLAQWCDHNQVPEKAASRYLGHSHGTMTYGRYSTDTPPQVLYASVTAPFTEYLRGILDIEGLKRGHRAKSGEGR